ncbi:LRR and PYD domains-containing 3-like protein [Labeo rohita]|uniref:LRR and PYD domains-containing 3-like protein n=1 Tax=Labeo rohita TaxID=84645 RepID=A0A498NY81_LABRO|nr:LRR and PYD domains-containing 3-like protein [Labeo rohita]
MLKNSLMDLVKIELKEFQWHLQNDHECISNSEIEEADIFDTVNKMVRCFGPGEAVKIAVDILRKMNQNNLAEQLENKHKQAQVEGNMKTSVLVGADSEQSLGSTSMDSKTSLYDYTEISLRLKKQLKQNCERILVGSTSMDSKTSLYDYRKISLRLKKQLKQNCERILVGWRQVAGVVGYL